MLDCASALWLSLTRLDVLKLLSKISSSLIFVGKTWNQAFSRAQKVFQSMTSNIRRGGKSLAEQRSSLLLKIVNVL
jgi:hypothetical protein